MMVTAIVATSRTGVIGDGVRMPWHLPRDLRRFREATMGKPMIMGRLTQQSLPRPLPGRLNIVLTRDPTYQAEGFQLASTLEHALAIAEDSLGSQNEVMIIGGGVVFRESLPLWGRLLLTVVEGDFQGKTTFPLDQVAQIPWRLQAETYCPPDAKNASPHAFLVLERIKRGSTPNAGEEARFDLAQWLKSTHPE